MSKFPHLLGVAFARCPKRARPRRVGLSFLSSSSDLEIAIAASHPVAVALATNMLGNSSPSALPRGFTEPSGATRPTMASPKRAGMACQSLLSPWPRALTAGCIFATVCRRTGLLDSANSGALLAQCMPARWPQQGLFARAGPPATIRFELTFLLERSRSN